MITHNKFEEMISILHKSRKEDGTLVLSSKLTDVVFAWIRAVKDENIAMEDMLATHNEFLEKMKEHVK